MKLFFLLFQLLLSSYIVGQNLSFDSGNTLAVVVGISDYQDEKIPDLKYAHRDAMAFSTWLQSPAGGNVPSTNIQLLLDEEATKGKVVMALTWLYEQSKEGDKAIIYFSGHGDVEKKLFNQPGYLLCRDAPPVVYMSGGTLSLYELQEVITTLSLGVKAQVLVITDACRAGNLAGAATGGPRKTTASLMNKFANEIKILSCQPSEYSIESEQWGGGRGAFSYHLEDALYGLADRDKDFQIKLKEVGRYLEDHVPVQTAPQVQNPILMGNREAVVALVDNEILAQWEAEKKKRKPTFLPADMKGMKDLILAEADSSIQQVYEAFLAAVEAGNLMPSSDDEPSANDYYEKLINESSIKAMHGLVKRNFVAALIDEAQQVTNKLLKTDPEVVSDTRRRPFVYDHIPVYLERATEILGPQHFIYKHLKAKQHYFISKTFRTDNYPDTQLDSLHHEILFHLEQAMAYDSSAAYICLEFSQWVGNKDENLPRYYLKKALDLAPNWILALQYLASYYSSIGAYGEATEYIDKAIELDSSFLRSYFLKMAICIQGRKWDLHEQYQNIYVKKVRELIKEDPKAVPVLYYVNLASILSAYQESWDEAEQILLQAIEITEGRDFTVYLHLSRLYRFTEDFEKREQTLKKLIELSPHDPNWYWELGIFYMGDVYQFSKAEAILKKAVTIDHSSAYSRFWLSEVYRRTGAYEQAELNLKEGIRLDSTELDLIVTLAEVYAEQRKYLKAIELLESHQQDLEDGWKYHDDLGKYYLKSGNYQKAIEHLETSKKIKNYLSTRYHLAEAYSKADQNELGKQIFRTLIEEIKNHPRQTPVKFYLECMSYLKLGQLGEFENRIRAEIEKRAEDTEWASYEIGRLYAQINESKKALTWLEEALQYPYYACCYARIATESDFDEIRELPQFIELMEKYFPDK